MSKRVMWGHMTHFSNFGTPYIYVIIEARNFKLGTKMDGSEHLRKKSKFGQKEFWNFGTPLSPKRLRLGTSNLA